MTTTFSSVVPKPGRRTAVPKPQPRRNAQRPGSTTASAASIPAQVAPPDSTNTSWTEGQTNEQSSQLAASPTIVRTSNSVQPTSSERRTREKPASDIVQNDRIRELNPTSRPEVYASEITKAVRNARRSNLSMPATTDPGVELSGTSQDPQLPTQPISRLAAGKKRKAADSDIPVPEIESSRSSDNTSARLENPSSKKPARTTGEVSSGVALPSAESTSTGKAPEKLRQSAQKPRAQPGPRKIARSGSGRTQHHADSNFNQQINGIQSGRRDTARAASVAQTDADALLQNITFQFSAVSRLADGIDGTSRTDISVNSRASPQISAQSTLGLANALNRAAHRRTQARAAADLATQVINEAVGTDVSGQLKRKRRRKSPDDVEEHVIDPTEVKMGDLTRDTGLGKKSGVEVALQNIDWKAVRQQKKEQAEETLRKVEAEKAEKRSGKVKKKKIRGEPQEDALVPGLSVVNGVIVAAAESREIDVRKDAEAEAARQDVNIIDKDRLTTRVNQNTVGRPKGLQGRGLHWSEEMEDRFYKGIRMFGADMFMVSSLFPGMERRHIKNKFVREERLNEKKLRDALFNPTSIDAEGYQEETGIELGDPRKLDEELKAMEADLRKRFEDQLAEQQAGTHPVEIDDADIPLQSREEGSVGPETGASRARNGRGGKENRFDATADNIVNEALGLRRTVAGVKKGKKKAAVTAAAGAAGRRKKDGSVAATRKGKKAHAAAQQLTGTVEEIGTVDEIPR